MWSTKFAVMQQIFLQNDLVLPPKEVDFDQFQNPVVVAERNMKNLLWVFLRRHSVPKQIIPSWTGFNIIVTRFNSSAEVIYHIFRLYTCAM